MLQRRLAAAGVSGYTTVSGSASSIGQYGVGAAAAPRPVGQRKRPDENAAVANPDIQRGKARRSRAAIEDGVRIVLVLVEYADHKIHTAGDVGVDQPRGGGSKRSSQRLPSVVTRRGPDYKNRHSIHLVTKHGSPLHQKEPSNGRASAPWALGVGSSGQAHGPRRTANGTRARARTPAKGNRLKPKASGEAQPDVNRP